MSFNFRVNYISYNEKRGYYMILVLIAFVLSVMMDFIPITEDEIINNNL